MLLSESEELYESNKYTRWYYKIIENAISRSDEDLVVERHHILPKSIWPEYTDLDAYPWNSVLLTLREHYICHWLLTKMVKTKHQRYKMSQAFSLMSNRTFGPSRKWKVRYNAGVPESVKKKISETLKKHYTKTSNPRKGQKRTPEQIARMKEGKRRSWAENPNQGMTGKKHTEERNAKMRGKNNPFYGKTHTEESKQKIRDTIANKQR